MKDLLDTITPICAKHDPDGIDLYFLNHRPKGHIDFLPGTSVRKSGYRRIGGFTALQTRDSVAEIFGRTKPSGKCNLGARLTKLLDWYCTKVKADEEFAGWNLIVITAGVFSDDVKGPLVHVAKTLDKLKTPSHQLGIQLLQVGNNPEVQKTFEYLDDELHKEAKTRDIIDTTSLGGRGTLSTDEMLKVVLGGVVKKLDECKSAGGAMPNKRVNLDD